MRSGWIDVRERVPEVSGRYLVCAEDHGYQRITIVTFGTRFQMNGWCAHWRVTHWMPLPALPGGRRGQDEPVKSRSRHYSKTTL